MTAYGAQLELTPTGKRHERRNRNGERTWRRRPRTLGFRSSLRTKQISKCHRRTTAKEILDDFPEGFDMLITGVGTGGHITGVSQVLKKQFPRLKVFAVEPTLSAVISGGKPGPHPLQGSAQDSSRRISIPSCWMGPFKSRRKRRLSIAQRCAREEGILVGISSGAALAAVSKKLPEFKAGGKILTFCYDTGERYLSDRRLVSLTG